MKSMGMLLNLRGDSIISMLSSITQIIETTGHQPNAPEYRDMNVIIPTVMNHLIGVNR
jgi:hypothetical protein